MLNLRSPIQVDYRYGYRIVVYAHHTSRRDLKRQANRNYRRVFKQQLNGGIEALSEFEPRRRCFLTGWDTA